MRSITEEARRVMNERRNFVNYAHVTLHDGTELNLTPSDFRVSGNSFTDDWCDGEAFQLGSAIGKTATLLLDNTDGRVDNTFTLQTSKPNDWDNNYGNYYTYDGSAYYPIREEEAPTWVADTYYTLTNSVSYPHGKFSEYDFYMSYFELYVHLPKSTTYQGELIDEIISIGTFTVTTPASHGTTIEITGVDNMYMFDKSFDDCDLDFSVGPTLKSILDKCCNDCGVAIGYTSFTYQFNRVYKKPQNATYRQIVSWIAQIAGCNAVISVTGALQLKWYNMSVFNTWLDGGRFNPWDGIDNVRDTYDGGSFNPWTTGQTYDGGNFTDPLGYHNLTATNGTTISTDDIEFTGVMVSYEITNEEGNTEKLSVHYPDSSDWDKYPIKIEDNPLIGSANSAETLASFLWTNRFSNLKFRVFSCQSIQDPTIEAGDCALVYDVKGNIYPTIITNVKFTTGGMTDVSCKAESPILQNTRYVNPAARAEANAIQKQDDYNAMVAHFNELAFAATSYYTIPGEDVDPQYAGTTFLCDHSTYASSTNIVWITGTGAFISTDGGQSYNSGLDVSTATLLMNYIYVHGVTADWIKVNKLEAISALMGTVYVGGGSNGDGVLYVRNASDATIVTLNNNGIDIDNGDINLGNGVFHVDNNGALKCTNIDVDGGDINLGNGVFHVTNAGALTATSATINGTITATGGSIGNNETGKWTIGGTAIYNGCTGTNSSAVNANNYGTYVGTEGIRNNYKVGNLLKYVILSSGKLTCNNVEITGAGGDANTNAINLSNVFKVTNAGALTATNATITGTITASKGGSIGAWNLRSNDATTSDQGAGALYDGSSFILSPNGTNSEYSVSGLYSDKKLYVKFGKVFAIDTSGNCYIKGTIKSTEGDIGPWTISSDGLFNNTGGAGAWVKPFEISCGKHSATLVKMLGKTSGSGDNGGYLSVEVNSSNDYVRVFTNKIEKKDDGGTKYAQFSSGSDERIKKDIEPLSLEEALSIITDTETLTFRYKEGNQIKHYGFIAQRIEKECEDLGIENPFVIYGEMKGDLKMVDYTQFIAPLMRVVQSQQEEINDLKERLAKLESIVNTML